MFSHERPKKCKLNTKQYLSVKLAKIKKKKPLDDTYYCKGARRQVFSVILGRDINCHNFSNRHFSSASKKLKKICIPFESAFPNIAIYAKETSFVFVRWQVFSKATS